MRFVYLYIWLESQFCLTFKPTTRKYAIELRWNWWPLVWQTTRTGLDQDWWRICHLGLNLKGHSGADWPVFFSRSIKSLIYNIFIYKVWTLNFYRKGQKFEVTFWRWEIPVLRTLPVGLAPSARWRLRIATIRRLIDGKTSAYSPRLKAIRFRHLNSVL